ncbi:hypothetical protein ALI22I_07270 [Saccharothrix sp. ALI-22-I]|uniref:hypothetical protein n=1 Tax=Saccharothrix sp. ALI-22-I TaxID=1933778 RepID=UPI00097C168D|nr:hypothetical protein [Saccharothrix sp. ALI-22-I]ONI91860.1 hypothetical protein ALI22I_07270 [Saccharothrix sp. ALI-22-I]
MSAELDGGAAPASLDELIVIDSLIAPAQDGGVAPQGGDTAVTGVPANLAEAEDAGPAPAPTN